MFYKVVYADPPWQQRKGGLRKVRPNQDRQLDYPTLTIEEIGSHLSKFNAPILFMWTIDKYLFEAEELGKRLGYKLHARLIWNKLNGMAPAFTIRFAHEYLLWMYKSPMLPIAVSARGRFLTVFEEKATKHSRKPERAYSIIEQLYPAESKIELYARRKRTGWDAWSNEVESDIELPLAA
jgi:N6-adenosine-specific RNA methylase IME4